MSAYEQKYTSMPHIEIAPGETLSEKQCYHLERLLCEVTLKYLHHIGISHPGVSCRKNTGFNYFAPLDFRDECGMSVVNLADLMDERLAGKYLIDGTAVLYVEEQGDGFWYHCYDREEKRQCEGKISWGDLNDSPIRNALSAAINIAIDQIGLIGEKVERYRETVPEM